MTDSSESSGSRGFTETSVFVGLGAVVGFSLVVIMGLAILAVGFSESDGGGSAGGGSLDGQVIYEDQCATCHGANGEGKVGPSLVGIADKYPDIGLQILIVEEGRNAMPSFKSRLSPEQIEAVVQFERTAFESDAIESDASESDAESGDDEAAGS